MGMVLYDAEGKLTHANKAAIELTGFEKIEDQEEMNLFSSLIIHLEKDKLVKEGLIKFQTRFDFENMSNNEHTSKNTSTDFIEGTVSVIDSGFLVQIQLITQRKESEELLISEEKYRSFFEEDLTGDFIATPEGRILECNPAFAEIYGFFNPEEAKQTNISQFNPEDWDKLIWSLKDELKIQGHQAVHQRPDGKQIHVMSNFIGVFDESNQLIQVKGYIFDDTERKEAEDALKESEEKYRLLFDEDLTGDFIADLDGKIVECNPAFTEIYGFNNTETALKWNISESNPFDWPYMVTRLKSEGKIQAFQSWQRRSDAMRIHVVANLVGIFNDSGELENVKGYVFDDTERKHAEEELERGKNQITMILDSIQDGFVALNNIWNIIYANCCASEYVGIDVDDLVGQNLWHRFPELDGTVYEKRFRKAMNDHEIQHFETRGIKTDQCFDFSVYPSDNGISIFWRDITRRKKLEKDLR